MLSLIIDRVGSVNIFNLLENNLPTDESHLQSIIDQDLILEYVDAVDKLVRISQSLTQAEKNPIQTDILHDLRVLGETFYQQFFPPEIIAILRTTIQKSIHFNLDPSLALIPWDLLHDGRSFLSDRFCIGKTIKGGLHLAPSLGLEKIKMLIIADPTEDLPGAEREGEMLFTILSQRISPKKLELEFIGGRQVTKLKLLSIIKDKNIIHFSGHLSFSEDPLENGWLLADGKVLKAREIKATGLKTDLVFSNSCVSARSSGNSINPTILNQFAGAFLASGIKTFVGTNWAIPDNEKTIDFGIRFYSFLFSEKSVGESLHLSKEFARRNLDPSDLTWASYSLFGNPDYCLVLRNKDTLAERKNLNLASLQSFFPSPIARSYMEFFSLSRSGASHQYQLKALVRVFESCSQILGILIFGDHKHRSLGRSIPDNPDDSLSITKWWELVYLCTKDFRKLNLAPFAESLALVLEKHRDVIQKVVSWLETWSQIPLDKEEMESYTILLQFFLENLLADLSEFEKIHIVYVPEHSPSLFFFQGMKPSSSFVDSFPGIEKHKGSLVAIHDLSKTILPFPAQLLEDPQGMDLSFPGFQSVLSKISKT